MKKIISFFGLCFVLMLLLSSCDTTTKGDENTTPEPTFFTLTIWNNCSGSVILYVSLQPQGESDTMLKVNGIPQYDKLNYPIPYGGHSDCSEVLTGYYDVYVVYRSTSSSSAPLYKIKAGQTYYDSNTSLVFSSSDYSKGTLASVISLPKVSN